MDEKTDGSTVGNGEVGSLMQGVKLVGENVGLLAEFDHTGDPDRRIASEEEVRAAEASFREMLAFIEGYEGEGHEQARANSAKFLRETLKGFNFRKENKLPGLRTQFLEARRQLVSGEKPVALDKLAKQPDAADLVEQLGAEYATFEEVMDAGGELNIDKLNDLIYRLNGREAINLSEAIGMRNAVEDLEKKLAGTAALAEAQGRTDLIERLHEVARRIENQTLVEAAQILDSKVNSFYLESSIDEEDDRLEYAGEVARLRGETDKGAEILSLAIKRADQLTGGTGLTDNSPIAIEAVTEDWTAASKELRSLRTPTQNLKLIGIGGKRSPCLEERLRIGLKTRLGEFCLNIRKQRCVERGCRHDWT